MKRTSAMVCAGLVAATLLLGSSCKDEGTEAPTTTTSASGAAGQGAGGGGGQGAEGGSGGQGAQGGSPQACLDPTEHADVLTLSGTELCVVAIYTAPVVVGTDPAAAVYHAAAPTWGRHGGPLLVKPGPKGNEDVLRVIRLTPPEGATGVLAVEEVNVALGVDGSFFPGAQAIDLPGGDWTLVSWTGEGAVGAAVATAGEKVAESFPTVGFFAGATVSGTDEQRLLHTGMTALDDVAGTPTVGLYATDFCAGPKKCASGSLAVDTWNSASGAVAVDEAGNVFAGQFSSSYLGGDDTTTVRGYGAAEIAPGTGAVVGNDILTVPASSTAMAALGPTGEKDGLLFLQPVDPATFVPADVLVQHYRVPDDTVVGEGPATNVVSFTATGTEATLMADPEHRLWLGVATDASESTFYVVARK